MQVESGPSVGQLLVILLGSIPLLGIMGWTAVKILGPVAQAISKRAIGGGDGEFLERRVEALAADLEDVKHQLAETHERLEFTERLLAQERPPEQLRRGSSN